MINILNVFLGFSVILTERLSLSEHAFFWQDVTIDDKNKPSFQQVAIQREVFIILSCFCLK